MEPPGRYPITVGKPVVDLAEFAVTPCIPVTADVFEMLLGQIRDEMAALMAELGYENVDAMQGVAHQ